VLDFKDFDPKTTNLSPEMLQAVINLEGTRVDDSGKAQLTIKNISTERHCFATVVTNAGEEAIRYRFFLSSKDEPLVEVVPLSPRFSVR
jgi:hypothetical protein